jgi:hypothetical protein
MWNTWLVFIAGLAQTVILGVMGFTRTVHPEFTQKHRGKIVSIYIGVALCVTGLSTFLSYQKDLENRKQWDIITGGTSYPAVIPQTHAGVPLPLIVHNEGNEILSGVTIRIVRMINFPASGDFFNANPIDVGTIAPHDFKEMIVTISPKLDENNQDAYWLQMSAQNGTVYEVIRFRKGKYCLSYATQFWVEKPVVIAATPQKTEMRNERLMFRDWSDDLGDGKCSK